MGRSSTTSKPRQHSSAWASSQRQSRVWERRSPVHQRSTFQSDSDHFHRFSRTCCRIALNDPLTGQSMPLVLSEGLWRITGHFDRRPSLPRSVLTDTHTGPTRSKGITPSHIFTVASWVDRCPISSHKPAKRIVCRIRHRESRY